MNEADKKPVEALSLPLSVVTRLDLSKLVQDAERIDDALTTAAVRTEAGATGLPEQPVMSEQLQSFLSENGLGFTSDHERAECIALLRQVKVKAPTVHMTFAVEADRESLQTITQWLRTSVHRQTIVEVGLQPALVAGVYLRTPNHVQDLSLRGALKGSHDVLVKELEALRGVS